MSKFMVPLRFFFCNHCKTPLVYLEFTVWYRGKKTLNITLTFDEDCHALFGRQDPFPIHCSDWPIIFFAWIFHHCWLVQAVAGKRPLDFHSAVQLPSKGSFQLHVQFFGQNIMKISIFSASSVTTRPPDHWFSE